MNLIPTNLRKLLTSIGVNRAVAWALIGQGATMLIQPITLLLITLYLTIQEQGYFYVFGSIIALHMFFDLGLGIATLHFVSHEAGHLTWTPSGILVGDTAAKSRLVSVLRLSLVWYATIAVLLVLTVLPGGWLYFLHREGASDVAWRGAWIWTVLGTATLLITVPLAQLLAACGKMAETMRTMTLQKVTMSLAQCLALILGMRLFSWPIGQTLGVAVMTYWLVKWGPAFRDLLRQPRDGPKVSWKHDLWPFQWKVALSALAFYMTSQTFSLVLFDETPAGKAEAARMGASLAIMNVLVATALTWVAARVPTFGHLVGRREWAELDRVFRSVFLQSVLVVAAAAITVEIAFGLFRTAGMELGNRVLPALPLGLLLANAVVQTIVQSLNNYLRAHKREPFLWTFVALGITMLIAVGTVGRAYGSIGMAASLLTLNTIICLGGGGLIFVRCRRAWHAEPAVETKTDAVPA
jgi:hypothetical protein